MIWMEQNRGIRLNRELILKIVKSVGLKIELGGGIRDRACVEDYLESGVSRVILGSAALSDPDFVKTAVRDYGERIAVGIDARDGKVATHGWLKTSETTFREFAKSMEYIGVKVIIFTDISRDGMLKGPNYTQLAEIQSAVSCRIIASGGVRDLDNIQKLREMGLYGAICGKSIYSGTLDLKSAVELGGSQNAC